MQKNTPQLWDKLWQNLPNNENKYNLLKEESGIKWQRIESAVRKKFGGFKGLKVIEVGAGSGTNAILFAKRGANVTILDYSKNAILVSKEIFKRNHLKADFILADALKLPSKLKGKYDIAMSFGLAEHFTGEKRHAIIKSHIDLIKSGGLVFISVPNKFNPPYRIHKFIAQLLRIWKYGEEYPWSRPEFAETGASLGLKNINFIGDSFWTSFRFINPFLILAKVFKKKPAVRKEKGSCLDSYLSYSLVFSGEKP